MDTTVTIRTGIVVGFATIIVYQTEIIFLPAVTLNILFPGSILSPASPSSTASRQSSGNRTPTKHFPPDWLESFQSLRLKSPRKVSPALSSLQGYYGLKATEKKMMSKVFEMAVYRKGEADYVDDGQFLEHSNSLLRLKRKSRSVANGFYDKKGEILGDIMSAGEAKDGEPDKSNEKLIRRRQKSEADFTARLLKDENNSNGGGGLSLSKRLAPRSKGGNRMSSGAVAEVEAEVEAGRFNLTSTTVGDELDGFEVRKSSSTSCLHDHEENGSSIASSSLTSLWPVSARKSKTALD
ncbi:uncharacterized protein LOC120149674 isoform X2 [Hibiscus syriacus]|uniref:uncharacterized protein LOC120149674 isoform X2 n=1 Tax=Hibiscus syriacus TaxID=106335 RepID=UPI00192230E6|nr:uncharacterized protein LOC120149674 isoform X2 [Hibiscus syriacus]